MRDEPSALRATRAPLTCVTSPTGAAATIAPQPSSSASRSALHADWKLRLGRGSTVLTLVFGRPLVLVFPVHGGRLIVRVALAAVGRNVGRIDDTGRHLHYQGSW